MNPEDEKITVFQDGAYIKDGKIIFFQDGKYIKDGKITPEGELADSAIELIGKFVNCAKKSYISGKYSQAKLYLEAANNTIYYAARQRARRAIIDD